MNTTQRICLLAILATLSACATQKSVDAADGITFDAPVATAAGPAGTILLVSLDDGTIIRQTIDVDAVICFKQNSASQTTCFSQGEAIVDPLTQEIIAYEMIEDRIELIAKSD